ncbi:undecaprenyl pyrophosphate synthetase (UPPS) [Vairimorpha necatrix]|uniref:Undecaprenyl pyrophosphate synthetase (UPPS) n=1 Tax=Vairimorpha necatrix TaxID=6039 RepID=A0AAX4JAV2_9MICR
MNLSNNTKTCKLKFLKIFLIKYLESIINSKYFLPFFRFLYKCKYLTNIYPVLIQFFPILCLLIYALYKKIKLFKNLKIAFIADGNRRYLKKMNKNVEQVKKEGLKKMWEIINLCQYLELSEVGFYCFSIKNFNRSHKEIQNVLQLLTHEINPKSYKIRVIGNMELLPENISNNLKKIVEKSKNNQGIIVNLFIAYSSQDEVENGIKFKGEVDLVIRTSGEKRLSDFLILQCCRGANIFFCNFLWPEITFMHVYLILLKYKLEQVFFK